MTVYAPASTSAEYRPPSSVTSDAPAFPETTTFTPASGFWVHDVSVHSVSATLPPIVPVVCSGAFTPFGGMPT